MCETETTQSNSRAQPRNEQALIDAAKAGDLSAFTQLVEMHCESVETLTRRILGRSDDVSDVVQEVFISVLQNLARYRGQATFATWLTRIVINRCRSEERWRLLRQQTYRRWAERRQQDTCSPAHESNLHDEVQIAVQELPLKYREVIVLRYLQEQSVSEVSKLLGISSNAVEVRLSRARQRLRDRLRNRFAEENRNGQS